MHSRMMGTVLTVVLLLSGVAGAKIVYVDSQANPTPISPQGLMGFWKMDDNAATKNVIDSGPNILNGMAVRNTADMHVAGNIDGALNFNGTGDQVDCGTNTKLLPPAWTAVAWVKCEDMASPTLLSFGNFRVSIKLQNNSTGKPAIIMAGNNYRTFDASAWTKLKDKNWHHVAFTMPGNAQTSIQTAQMYVDGVMVTVSATVATGGQLSKTQLFLGNTDAAGTQRFKGAMDQVMLFNRVLDAAEIMALYNNNQSANSGLSWNSPLKTIGEAINAAAGGDEIWVKKGTYTLTQTLTVDKALKFYGGFAGTESELAQRDVQLNLTTVDGNNAAYHCFLVTADATIDGFTITGGKATGALDNDRCGGGIYIENALAQVIGCTITGNQASADGGGVFNYGGDSESKFRSCTFAANTAANRGGAFYGGSPTPVEDPLNPRWPDSTVNRPELANCLVLTNTAVNGGGIFFGSYSNGDILNCTIVGNAATTGGGLYVQDSYCYPQILNTILWNNTAPAGPQIHFVATGVDGSQDENLQVVYSDIEGGWDHVWINIENLNLDPAFVDADGPDNNPATWDDNDYRLLSTSPIIDKGSAQHSALTAPVTDFLGTKRPQGAQYDIGAYEYKITGDADNDGITDIFDLLILSENWLLSPCDAANNFCDGADFDRNGKVDLMDFTILSEFWLRTN